MQAVFLMFLLGLVASAQTVVQFSTDPGDTNPSAYSTGPFPTDALSVSDPSQPTGERIQLPASEDTCQSTGAVCGNLALLNQQDGFSVNPRLMVCFSGPVNTSSLQANIAISSVGTKNAQQSVSVTKIIVDPQSNCAYAKPVHPLDQESSYVLSVTNGIQDASGHPVQASPDFQACLASSSSYCQSLAAALKKANLGSNVVSASLFTTGTVTRWLEQARSYAYSLPSIVLPAGFPSTFQTSKLSSITWSPSQAPVSSVDVPLAALQNVATVAFGIYLSPNYLNAATGTISAAPNAPVRVAPVSFHVFVPAAPKLGKIPVVIYGHGLGDNQFGAPTFMASTLAKNGFATIAYEVTGFGYGATSTVTVKNNQGNLSKELTPGRGLAITSSLATDGCIIPGPYGIRDCARQSAVDLFTLVHDIQSTNGLGLNLDPTRIYYVGQSLGSTIGTLFMATDPNVKTAVLNGAGGSSVDVARTAITSRPLAASLLVSLPQNPLLLNVAAGIAPLQTPYGVALSYGFNDEYVFGGTVVASVPGALQDQAAFEAAEWIDLPGDPIGFASHLTLSPLPGVGRKNVLYQFGIGDLEVPNPAESDLVNAAGAQNSVSLFNFPAAVAIHAELASMTDPAFGGLPILPHRIMSNPTILTGGNENELAVAVAEQQQVADFFSSNGRAITDPDTILNWPTKVFQNAPATLPTRLNFVQFQ